MSLGSGLTLQHGQVAVQIVELSEAANKALLTRVQTHVSYAKLPTTLVGGVSKRGILVNAKRSDSWLYVFALLLAGVLAWELIRLGVPPTHSDLIALHFARRGIEYACLYAVYFIWLLKAIAPAGDNSVAPGDKLKTSVLQAQTTSTFTRLLMISSPFLLLALAAAPCTTDIYLYLQYGCMSIHGINPYLVSSANFTSPVPMQMITWHQTCAYGPISLLVFSVAAAFAKHGVCLAIYVLKLETLAFHLLNGYIVWRATGRSKTIGLAYLLNPTILLEHVVNGHADAFLCLFILLALLCIRRELGKAATLAVMGGILTKILPILWVPLLLLWLAARRRWADILFFAAIAALSVFALSQTLLPTRSAWIGMLNPSTRYMAMASPHFILRIAIEHLRGLFPTIIFQKRGGILQLFKMLTSLLFGLYYTGLLRLYLRRGRGDGIVLIAYMGWANLILYLLATPWYQPWYATTLIPFAVFRLGDRFWTVLTIVFVVSGDLAYYILAGTADWIPQLWVALLTVLPTSLMILARMRRSQWRELLARMYLD